MRASTSIKGGALSVLSHRYLLETYGKKGNRTVWVIRRVPLRHGTTQGAERILFLPPAKKQGRHKSSHLGSDRSAFSSFFRLMPCDTAKMGWRRSVLKRHCVRVVKELVLKANGLCPREFKSRRCRVFVRKQKLRVVIFQNAI